MKRKIIITILWMVIFAAVTFCIIPITFAVVVFSHIMSDTSLEYILWPLRLIFVASPWVALLLGLRGSLPGTRPLAVTRLGTGTISKILTLIVIVIVVLFTLGAWVAFLPPPGRPNISITFLGYTNDATGARLARFAITNLNHSTIFAYNPNIEIQSPTEQGDVTNYWPGYNQWQQLHSTLDEGASINFTIIPPTNQSPWRLAFYVYPDRGKSAKNTIKSVVSISCLSVGLWPLFAGSLPLDGAFRMPYDFESDWIKNEK
ncbi:MAG TPA: hypothetical protein VG077_00490 [Verrucomicrobiae bacterium]|nr:hypothetical protein [Verrucomicrobiae bacterium]